MSGPFGAEDLRRAHDAVSIAKNELDSATRKFAEAGAALDVARAGYTRVMGDLREMGMGIAREAAESRSKVAALEAKLADALKPPTVRIDPPRVEVPLRPDLNFDANDTDPSAGLDPF